MRPNKPQKSVKDARRDLMHRVQTEGMEVAYATALEICRSPNAPAPAKATALTALFRVGGGFEKENAVMEKEPHEMDGAELAAAAEQIMRRLAKGSQENEESEGEGGSPFD